MATLAQVIIGIFVFALIVGVIAVLPDASFPTGVNDALTSTSHYIAPLNSIIPIDTLIDVLTAMAIVEIVWLSYRLFVMVIAKITHGQH